MLAYSRRRQWQPTPVLLPGKSHGLRSLVGCSPWGHEESGTTEQLHFRFSLSCMGGGNGNPLQCSCLENPRVRHDWSDLAAAAVLYQALWCIISFTSLTTRGGCIVSIIVILQMKAAEASVSFSSSWVTCMGSGSNRTGKQDLLTLTCMTFWSNHVVPWTMPLLLLLNLDLRQYLSRYFHHAEENLPLEGRQICQGHTLCI